jgi:ribosomal protein S18 acetylase RimI-like enzyme
MEIRVLGAGDAAVLDHLAPGVFDRGVDPRRRDEFFADPRHHLAVAVDGGTVVGMVSAVHYVHPDKPPELWINEVGVAASHRRMGLARQMLDAMLDHARALGCGEAWVLTDVENDAAMRLYASAGGVEQHPQPVMFSFRLDGEG